MIVNLVRLKDKIGPLPTEIVHGHEKAARPSCFSFSIYLNFVESKIAPPLLTRAIENFSTTEHEILLRKHNKDTLLQISSAYKQAVNTIKIITN